MDANGVWDVDTAVSHIRRLDRAAGGLEYVEQPCRTIDELAAVRRRGNVRIAADESIRRADDPRRVAVAGAADVVVIKCTPLGGVRRSLRVAEAAGLSCVVSSALETSVGLASQVALAGALPELGFACGLDTLSLLDGDVVTAGASLRPVEGYLPAPDGVLGFPLDRNVGEYLWVNFPPLRRSRETGSSRRVDKKSGQFRYGEMILCKDWPPVVRSRILLRPAPPHGRIRAYLGTSRLRELRSGEQAFGRLQ